MSTIRWKKTDTVLIKAVIINRSILRIEEKLPQKIRNWVIDFQKFQSKKMLLFWKNIWMYKRKRAKHAWKADDHAFYFTPFPMITCSFWLLPRDVEKLAHYHGKPAFPFQNLKINKQRSWENNQIWFVIMVKQSLNKTCHCVSA